MNAPLIEVTKLSATYRGGARAVLDVSFQIAQGESFALVGESGCGKTTIARALLGMLPHSATLTGSIRVDGREVLGASRREFRKIRGHVIGFVAQDPYGSLNPLLRVGHNVAEAWRVHGLAPPAGAVPGALAKFGIEDAAARSRQWPHQWSGGMLQRACIAAAAALNPPLIVADEPTSALDADTADATLGSLRGAGASLLLVSHDIDIVRGHTNRVAVCYAGRIVEIGETQRLLGAPRHPYTRALLAAIPRPGHGLPEPLDGSPPDPRNLPIGCAFAPRCAMAEPQCLVSTPPLRDGVACPVVLS